MYPDGLTSLSFEKPALHFLSLTLDTDFSFDSEVILPTEMGRFSFKKLDLVQERGKLPLLVLDFELEEGTAEILYFGHISPFKLHCFRLCRKGYGAEEYFFSKKGMMNEDPAAADFAEYFPADIDFRIVTGSLYLWRSCVGLPKVCAPDLVKYFSKMKTVSRYQWKNDEYRIENSDSYEKWTGVIPVNKDVDVEISVFFKNGLLCDVKL